MRVSIPLNRPMKRVASVRAISFDADGTLWDFEKVMRHSLRQVLRELKRIDPTVTDALSVDGMIEVRNRVAEELRGKVTNPEQIRLEAFRQTLSDVGRPDDELAVHLNQV
jgi:phosphoglycolate phosphatase-like HAD superfamily hydrolase